MRNSAEMTIFITEVFNNVSVQILNAYSTDGIDFLDRAFNSPPDYLEDLTGLSEMRNTSDVDVIELSDDDF